MKNIFLFFLIIISFKANACKCVNSDFIYRYYNSDFIAKVKIIDIKKDDKNVDTFNVKIEILELYKGKRVNKFKIIEANSSCGLYTPVNSTWLIFLQNYNGELITSYCLGSIQIDIEKDNSMYPNFKKNHLNKIDLTINVLKKLKKYSKKNNDFNLKIAYNNLPIKLEVGNYKVSNQNFAIYELIVRKDLSIKKVKTISEFDNNELSKKLNDFIQKKVIIDKKTKYSIPKQSKLLVVYFFYNGDDKNKSQLSFMIL